MSDLELGPEERSLIAAASSAHIPSEVQRVRVRRGLDAKLAAGVAAPLLAGSTALAMTGKVGVVIALVATVGAGTAYLVTARPAPRVLPAQVHRAAAPTAPAAGQRLAPQLLLTAIRSRAVPATGADLSCMPKSAAPHRPSQDRGHHKEDPAMKLSAEAPKLYPARPPPAEVGGEG